MIMEKKNMGKDGKSMNRDIRTYLDQHNEEIQMLFERLRELLFVSVNIEVEERLWAKLPSFYAGSRYIRLIPFKDHINIEASGVMAYKAQLDAYKITPKGLLKLYLKQDIPEQVLKLIFSKTLEDTEP